MENEKSLVNIASGELTESEVVSSAIAFAQQGFGGKPITLPRNYDITRAIKNFCFALPNVKNIGCATKESIFKAMHEYITKGLDISKHQCALIVYKDKDAKGQYTGNGQLSVQTEYFGNLKITKAARPDIEDISNGTVIFDGDKIALKYDKQGRLQILHETSFNNWSKPIVGAYAVVTFRDGTYDSELMTINDIRAAWAKSGNGNAVHNQFPVEMAKKTVLNRLCKKLLNSTDDIGLLEESDKAEEYESIDIDEVSEISQPTLQINETNESNLEPNKPQTNEADTFTGEVVSAGEEVQTAIVDENAEDYSITIPYGKYKEDYSNCKTGNYNRGTGRIEVFPNQIKQQKEPKEPKE